MHRLFEWFTRHQREISDFQLEVTAIPAPPFGEQPRAILLSERLAALGVAPELDDAGNLLAWRSGSGVPGAAIAISAHMDTVFPAGTPLEIRRENTLLMGPGISDNGAGLAALWALAAAFAECGIATALPLLFIANVGEEGEGNLRGMKHIYRQRLPRDGKNPEPEIGMLIVLDGAGCGSIITQALGSRRFEVVISGPGGHSWSDFGTPNPIVAAALAIRSLSLFPLPANPRTTLNVGHIQGGTSINTIPERVAFKVDLRSADTARLDELEEQLRRVVAAACAEAEAKSTGGRLSFEVMPAGERPAGELAEHSPLLAAVRAVDAHLGIRSELLRASTDANIPISLGREAVSLGAGGNGGGAHTVHEWYDPAGREQALKRLALIVLLLAGLGDAAADPTALGAGH